MGRQDEDREAARERRRAYYESLSPEEKKAYRERVIRAKKIKKLRKMAIQAGAILLLIIVAVIGVLVQKGCGKPSSSGGKKQESETIDNTPGESAAEGTLEAPEWVIEDFIRIHEDSRPGTAMGQVKGIVIHYTGQAGTSAEATRLEYDKLDAGEEGTASSHFVIGIDGTVIQFIPLSEISYAAGEAYTDWISIQCCHIDEGGKFSNATYQALVRLVNWLLDAYDLAPETVLRHYDVTGENCPSYYVDNLDAWNQFLTDIGGTPIVVETPEAAGDETGQGSQDSAQDSSEEDSEEAEEPSSEDEAE